MKNTPIDAAKAEKRKTVMKSLRVRGPVKNEKTLAGLREWIALIEEILGVKHDIRRHARSG